MPNTLFPFQDDAYVGNACHDFASHVVSDADANRVAFVQLDICEVYLVLEVADATATLFS